MINKQALFDVIKYNHFSFRDMDYIMGFEDGIFKKKLQHGIFQSNEIEMMLNFLKFPVDPFKIFFDTYDWENPRKIEWD